MLKLKAVLIPLGYLLFTATAPAQLVSIGVKGGIFVTDRTYYNSDESKRYVVGPSIEFKLPARFAAEIDALYSRAGQTVYYTFTASTGAGPGEATSVISRSRANVWEFPVLGKYYFGSRGNRLQPFVGTGYVFREVWFENQVTATILSPVPIGTATSTSSGTSRSSLGIGASVIAGVRYKAGRLSVLPEMRYTHWGQDSFSRRNELKFLLGISF